MMRIVLVILFSSLCSMIFAADKAVDDDLDQQPVRLKKALEAILPADLTHLQIEEPRVVYWVCVDSEGSLIDFLALEATHHALLDKAEEKLHDAEFFPAKADGAAVQAKTLVLVTFYDPEQRAWKRGLMSMPMGSTVMEGAESRIYALSKANFVYSESRPEELDKPLQLLESELCMVHEPGQPMEKGKVIVEYYVDHKGNVRHPTVITSDGKSLSLSALMTLQKTRFAPPLKNGKPTYVRVRQPFNFN